MIVRDVDSPVIDCIDDVGIIVPVNATDAEVTFIAPSTFTDNYIVSDTFTQSLDQTLGTSAGVAACPTGPNAYLRIFDSFEKHSPITHVDSVVSSAVSAGGSQPAYYQSICL